MTTIIDLIRVEEGWRERPYLCSEGYPTVGYGFKLGPKIIGPDKEERCRMLYDFELPRTAGDVWLAELVAARIEQMKSHPRIGLAYVVCASPGEEITARQAVLISMAFQMGVDGLAAFRQTLLCIQSHDWFQAETQMLKSRWANQTPERARRHARQIRTGQWDQTYQLATGN